MDKFRIAIIGAGTSGLTAIKQCLDDDLAPVCFEKSSFVGGLWRYEEVGKGNEDPHSSIYKSIKTNTTKEMTAFSDFPIPEDWPTFMGYSHVEKYIDMYAEKFNLLPHIKLNTTVLNVSILTDKRWKIKYVTRGKGGDEEKEEIFDYVMVCSGHYHHHRWPKYKGMDTFGGEQMHSHFYREPTNFENKRVLVVGSGSSGMDIAVELSHVASQVYLSVRKGKLPWIVPHFLGGRAYEHRLSRFFAYAMPLFIRRKFMEKAIIKEKGPYPPHLKPKEPLFATHAVINSGIFGRLATGTIIVKPDIKELKSENHKIEFVDGTILENIDVVIYSTGYCHTFPFLEKDVVTGGKAIEEEYGEEYKEDLIWMYKTMFPPRYPNIAFVGLASGAGAIFPVSEMQSRYITSQIRGFIKPLPSPVEMDKSIHSFYARIRETYSNPRRHTVKIMPLLYMDELSKEIGCYPYSFEIIKKFGFGLWKLIIFGFATPVQFRLLGRNSWEGSSEAILQYNKNAVGNITKKYDDHVFWASFFAILLVLMTVMKNYWSYY